MLQKILIVLMLGIFNSLALYSQNIIHAELLGKPTDTSISVQLFFDQDIEMSVRYGTLSGIYTQQTRWYSFMADTPAEIILTNLQPNTRYFYQVLYRRSDKDTHIFRREHTFHTQRAFNTPFTFVVQADPHLDEQSDTALYRLCLQNQLGDNPDFMIDLGDITMNDKLKNKSNRITRDTIVYRCHYLRSYYEEITHSVPLFIALGNHEGEAGWQLSNKNDNIAVWGTLERKKYFTNPSPNVFYSGDTTIHNDVGLRENYYAWEWGNSLFVVLDPYWYTMTKPDSMHGWRWTLGKAQYDWLHSVLRTTKSTYKFIFAHQLIGGEPDGRGGVEFADLYEWGGNNLDGTYGFSDNRSGWYKPIKELLKEYKVTIFFHGHDHFFAKQQKDCLVYQETPQPSHPNFQNAGQADDYGYVEGVILPNSGHLRVTVQSDNIKVEYIRAYLPNNETKTRKNKDVSATYSIGIINCYDSLYTSIPVLWNKNYKDELIHPNPFSTQTMFDLVLPNDDIISILITDSQGKIIRTLLSEDYITQGDYTLVWDAKDIYGNTVPSGNYYYSIHGRTSGTTSGILSFYK